MQAISLEYRFRLVIFAVIVTLGFWAPWIDIFQTGGRSPCLLWVAHFLAHFPGIPIAASVFSLTVLSALFAAAGALLRVWGRAWPPPFAYDYTRMDVDVRPVAGPYLYTRNPLPLGMGLILFAASFYMPVAGTPVAVALCALLLYRLVCRNEFFLTAELGGRYRDYCNRVPPWFPRLHAGPHRSALQPLYGRALLSELGSLAAVLTLAVVPWAFDRQLLIDCLLVSAGIALLARAFVPRLRPQAPPAA